MADTICNCPHCNQPVTIDDSWAGQQLQCPACQQAFIAPGGAPPPPAPVRQPTGRPGASHPQRTASASSKAKAKEKSDRGQKIAFAAIVLVVLGVGAFVFVKFGGQLQKKFSESTDKEAAEGGGGGQMGHIADVYDALDRTDPDKMMSDPGPSRPGRREVEVEEKPAPIIPAVWSLDLDTAKIPESEVNGTISGGKFLCDTAELNVVGNAIVLSLQQEEDTAIRGIMVYLRLKPGEKLGGGSWTISKDMKGAGVPPVTKRWQPNPQFAPTTKNYTSGYAMKLELGLIRRGEVKGKVFISLPDTEKTVIAGTFTAETTLPDTPETAAAAAPAPAKQ